MHNALANSENLKFLRKIQKLQGSDVLSLTILKIMYFMYMNGKILIHIKLFMSGKDAIVVIKIVAHLEEVNIL